MKVIQRQDGNIGTRYRPGLTMSRSPVIVGTKKPSQKIQLAMEADQRRRLFVEGV